MDLVRRHFGLVSMAVLGHSWGGVLAMEYAVRHRDRVSHLILMNTAPASHADLELFRRHLRGIRPAAEVEAMESLAASAGFRAGDLDVEARYYRLPRLRASYTPERVRTARAIEDRLYEQTWASPDHPRRGLIRRIGRRRPGDASAGLRRDRARRDRPGRNAIPRAP
jgi:proline iminopeptidase